MADKHDQSEQPFADLPIYTSGWSAGEWDFEPGEAFWQNVVKVGTAEGMSDHMDAAMEGKSAPRVWLIMHEPGQPELSTTVAMAFARELGARDQAALVLDCDDQSQALTTWAERAESDGWIDLLLLGRPPGTESYGSHSDLQRVAPRNDAGS